MVSGPAAKPSSAHDGGPPRPLWRTLLEPANLMSLVRIPLGLLTFAVVDDAVLLIATGVVAAVTDLLDGMWARRTGHAGGPGTHNVGAWLDPVCDKLFVLAAAIAVVAHYQPSLGVLALVLVRDVALLALFLLFRVVRGRDAVRAHDYRAARSGKNTTVLQFLTLLAVVVWPAAVWPLAVASAGVGAFAVVVMARRALHAPGGSSSPPSATAS